MQKEKDCDVCLSSERGYNKVPGLTRKYFYLCDRCLKEIRLPKEETITRWGRGLQASIKQLNAKHIHVADPYKQERTKAIKKLIKAEYETVIINRFFGYPNYKT